MSGGSDDCKNFRENGQTADVNPVASLRIACVPHNKFVEPDLGRGMARRGVNNRLFVDRMAQAHESSADLVDRRLDTSTDT